MRFLILSDIHSNFAALEAVAKRARGNYDSIVCLGDVVGYGPDPNPVTDWVRKHCQIVVRGNHDRAATGDPVIEEFSDPAADAAIWTQSQLTAENLEYLRALPQGPLAHSNFWLCHGSPRDEDEYLTNKHAAQENAGWLTGPITFFGHTHHQGAFAMRGGRCWLVHRDRPLTIEPDTSYLINPGSVGQPRDGNPEAAYALFDDASKVLAFCRVPYDIEQTQTRIRNSALHPYLAERLTLGH